MRLALHFLGAQRLKARFLGELLATNFLGSGPLFLANGPRLGDRRTFGCALGGGRIIGGGAKFFQQGLLGCDCARLALLEVGGSKTAHYHPG